MFRRLVNLIRWRRLDADIREELEFHRSQTAGSFGNVTAIHEQTRDASTIVWVETLIQDVRIALRLLRRTPSFTAIALLSTALSVGATAVVFTAVKTVLLRPLPYSHPSELIQLMTRFAGGGQSHTDWVFWNDTQEIIRRTRTLQSLGVYSNAVFDLGGGGLTPPEALYGARISANLFPTLGVSPMLGRNILPEEDQFGRPNELILSYGLWARRFNADQAIVGKKARINGHDCLVIGVMPPDFSFPLRRGAAHTPEPYVEFWAPMKAGQDHELGRENPSQESAAGAVGRLRAGVSLAEARRDLASISKALANEYPVTNRDRTLQAGFLWDRTLGSVRPALWLLMAAACLFLLIGCANIANLLLARALARQREIAIRVAIGAGKFRLIRQMLTESCVLATLGGVAGYALTTAAWKVLPALAPASIPRLASARTDWTIFLFALVVALANGFLFGLAPALRLSGVKASISLHGLAARAAVSAGKKDRMRGALVIAEVGLTLALVLIGGQLLSNFVDLLRIDPGFQSDRILASVVLPEPERYRTPEQRSAVYGRFVEAARSVQGVTSVGTVDALPFSGENHGGSISNVRNAPSDPKNQSIAEIDVVGAEYLQTLGVHLVMGRWFRGDDMRDTNETVIINDFAAQRLWPRSSAIGEQLCVNCTPEQPKNWKRVIGVVSSVRHADLDSPPGFNVYLSSGAYANAAFVVVRTTRPIGEVSKAIQRAIASIDPNQSVLLTASMQSFLADSIADRRFFASLLTATGCLALLIALAGIYGVTSYTTSRRTQEIGVRMALGATPANVHALLFRQSFQTVAAGLAIGLLLALVAMHTLRGMIPGIGTGRLTSVWVAGCSVLITAALACWIPAHRVTRNDPMSALRQD